MRDNPHCRKKSCFANMEGGCVCLIQKLEPCPFYKPKEQIENEKQSTIMRLKALGLINRCNYDGYDN